MNHNINNLGTIIPELSGRISIYPFDKDSFIVHELNFGCHVRINTLTLDLIKLVDGKKTIIQIADELKRKNISLDTIYKTLFGVLAKNGIILSDQVVDNDGGKYLKLKIPLLKELFLKRISNIFVFLFSPKTFIISFVLMLIYLTTVIAFNFSWAKFVEAISPINLLYLCIFSLLVTLFHELGHVTACRSFGASHGDIGFAIYILSPVFYADVSNAWNLKRHQRVIIDMAGLYMELIVATILTTLFLILGNSLFLFLTIYIIIHSYSNLNPFFRYDAYWALSDLTNIPNLRKDSNRIVKEYFISIFKGSRTFKVKHKKESFLLVYGALSIFLLALFLLIVLITNFEFIVYFSINAFFFFKVLVTDYSSFNLANYKDNFFRIILLPISFYYIVFRVIFRRKNIF